MNESHTLSPLSEPSPNPSHRQSLATKLKLLCGAPLAAPSSQEQEDEEDEEEIRGV